jgi:membrane-associated phospholipid phosphatase
MDRFSRSVARVILSSFSGYGLWIQIAVALSTAFLVLSGADWAYFQATRSTALAGVVIFAAAAGFIIPVAGPLLLYFLARARQDARSHLMVQSVVVAEMAAFLIAAAYKAVTGRLQPNLANGADISRAFQFGILHNGIFWGWPSSHTIVAFAAAVVIVLSVRSRVARAMSILYALIIGFGASVGFHWFSDVVAGALLGTLVALKTQRDSK